MIPLIPKPLPTEGMYGHLCQEYVYICVLVCACVWCVHEYTFDEVVFIHMLYAY